MDHNWRYCIYVTISGSAHLHLKHVTVMRFGGSAAVLQLFADSMARNGLSKFRFSNNYKHHWQIGMHIN
jgi:hypothetical protein